MSISRLHDLGPDRLAELVTESEEAGFRFLRRLVDDWDSGSEPEMPIKEPGEAQQLCRGVQSHCWHCGLNSVYPLATTVRRVLYLYVAVQAYRRRGISALAGYEGIEQDLTTHSSGFGWPKELDSEGSGLLFPEVIRFSLRSDGEAAMYPHAGTGKLRLISAKALIAAVMARDLHLDASARLKWDSRAISATAR